MLAMPFALGYPIMFYYQGIGAQNATTLLNNSNLTIKFYNDSNCTILFNEYNFTNQINNGQWQVLIESPNFALETPYYAWFSINNQTTNTCRLINQFQADNFNLTSTSYSTGITRIEWQINTTNRDSMVLATILGFAFLSMIFFYMSNNAKGEVWNKIWFFMASLFVIVCIISIYMFAQSENNQNLMNISLALFIGFVWLFIISLYMFVITLIKNIYDEIKAVINGKKK